MNRSEIIEHFRARDYRRGLDYAASCVLLAALRDDFIAENGKQQGSALFRETRAEELSLGASPASKMLTVADNIGAEGEELPAAYQYQLARAVKRDPAERDRLIVEAHVMPLADFVEVYALVKPREKAAKRLTCPECGVIRPAEDFEVAP